MATTTERLTAEEFLKLPDSGRPMELRRGVPMMMNVPGGRHGEICLQIGHLVKEFLSGRELGRALSNDAGVLTERNPDSVRGADVAYYSFERLPRGPAPTGYPANAPEVVFEVLSPSNSWAESLAKTAEYLNAGVLAVVLCDPEDETLYIYRQNASPRRLTAGDTLELPEIHDDFRMLAARFFESA
jgi:Uma2 family endonuclease